MTPNIQKGTRILDALLPIAFLFGLIVYGLILRPQIWHQAPIPLEIIFILAAVFMTTELLILGHSWIDIQQGIIDKLGKALPAFFILFCIGLIISSWIVSGTIPMLVFYGLKSINPKFIYLLAFIVPVVFSSLTGTSWGSAGTIGVVIIGIATAMQANLGITAGAVIGGAYFGDKMSPLSDTTNLAALAADVNLYDHIQSMTVTTLPSAALAAIAYFVLGFIYPPEMAATDMQSLSPFLNVLEDMFRFHWLLLLPPAIVLYSAIRKKPTVPALISATLTASVLALIFQKFTLTDILQTLHKGFHTDMAHWVTPVPEQVQILLNRGGLYALIDAIVISFMVFIFIGAMDQIDVMPRLIQHFFRNVKSRSGTILSTLGASAVTNTLTSNQFATSFIIADAFKAKYDDLGIPRKVLSRSLEDYGTMIESMVPWTTTAVFMVGALGVPWSQYWHWQLLSLINFIIAPTVALLGIGCFYNKLPTKNHEQQS